MGYVWDEAPPAPPRVKGEESIKRYVWEEDAARNQEAQIYPVANYEAVQRRINEMVEELRAKRDSVRERRIELRRLRDSAAAESRELQIRWEAKKRQSQEMHEEKIQAQQRLAAQLQEDSRQLKRRIKELQNHENQAESIQANELQVLVVEHRNTMNKAKEAWTATENKELAAVVEKRRDAIKAKVIKALEPEVQRLVKSHREEINKRREDDEASLQEYKAQLKNRYEHLYMEENVALGKKFEKEVVAAQAEVEAHRREERKRAEKEIEFLWESEKQSLNEERKRYESERDRLDEIHRSDIQDLAQREAQAMIDLENEHKMKLKDIAETEVSEAQKTLHEHDIEMQTLVSKFNAQANTHFDTDLAQRLAPVRDKCQRELTTVWKKLDTESERAVEALSSTLEKERAELMEAHHDALAKIQTQEADAMQQYMATAKQQQSLQSEISTLEHNIETLREQTSTIEQELRDTGLEREKRLQKATDLQSQIQAEHEAQQAELRQAILETNRRFDQAIEDIITADQAARDSETLLQAERRAQLQQIEAKINTVIQRRLKDRDKQLALLQEAQQRSSDLDAQIALKREQQLASS